MPQAQLTLQDERRLARIRGLARLLDNAFVVPGTNFRFGIDALIGLVPGIGDLIGVLFSLYIIGEAIRIGAPRMTVVRMVINVLIEGVFGIAPLLGDLFDTVWKANIRNIRLMDQAITDGRRRQRVDTFFVVGLAVVLLGAVTGLVAAAVAVLVWLAELLSRLL